MTAISQLRPRSSEFSGATYLAPVARFLRQHGPATLDEVALFLDPYIVGGDAIRASSVVDGYESREVGRLLLAEWELADLAAQGALAARRGKFCLNADAVVRGARGRPFDLDAPLGQRTDDLALPPVGQQLPFRRMTEQQRSDLAAAISVDGGVQLHRRITVDQFGRVIDGHLRRAVLTDLGVDWHQHTERIDVESDVDALRWAIVLNAGQRPLSPATIRSLGESFGLDVSQVDDLLDAMAERRQDALAVEEQRRQEMRQRARELAAIPLNDVPPELAAHARRGGRGQPPRTPNGDPAAFSQGTVGRIIGEEFGTEVPQQTVADWLNGISTDRISSGRNTAPRRPDEEQRQASINVRPQDWERFKELAQAEGKSAAAKLGELIIEALR